MWSNLEHNNNKLFMGSKGRTWGATFIIKGINTLNSNYKSILQKEKSTNYATINLVIYNQNYNTTKQKIHIIYKK